MKASFLILNLVVALFAAGCSRSVAHDEQHHEHSPAAIYKAGLGIQLSNTARAAVGVNTMDVGARDFSETKGAAAIPRSALLRTVKGDFVYVANAEWFLRTPVTIGAADGDWLEVKDGLYEGDTVVTEGVRALWLSELQAVNGGVGCADDN